MKVPPHLLDPREGQWVGLCRSPLGWREFGEDVLQTMEVPLPQKACGWGGAVLFRAGRNLNEVVYGPVFRNFHKIRGLTPSMWVPFHIINVSHIVVWVFRRDEPFRSITRAP